MGDFQVATEELIGLAKKAGEASQALDAVATSAGNLTLPSGAFGRLNDSDIVAASYTALQQRLADTSKKGSKVLGGVDEGLRAVARRYSEDDASVASAFEAPG